MKKTLLLPLSTKTADTQALTNAIRSWLAPLPDEFEFIFLHDLPWSDDWLTPRDSLFAEMTGEYQRMGDCLFERLTETLQLDVPKTLFISIVGTWLYNTMSSLLEMYKLCTACPQHLSMASAFVLSFPSAALPAHNSVDCTEIYAGSTLRLAVFGEIATKLGIQCVHIPQNALPRFQKPNLRRQFTAFAAFTKYWLLENIYNFFTATLGALFGGPQVIADSGRMAAAIFSLRHKTFPTIINLKLSLLFKRRWDAALRQRILSEPHSHDTDFSNIVLWLIPHLMPAALLENNLQRLTAVQQPKTGPTSAIFSFNNSTGAQLALKQLQEGPSTKRVTVTHGGGYGISGMTEELIDNAISHTTFTFGWPTHTNTVHFHPSFLAASHLRYRQKHTGLYRFAIISISPPLYCYKICALPISPNQIQKYYDDQQQFLVDVGASLSAEFVYRPSPILYGHLHERWYEVHTVAGAAVNTHTGKNFSCLNYDLMVVDHIGTSLTIRAMANLPFVIYCRPEWWHINPAAAALVYQLKDARVWHDSPESAASFVREISHDIRSWWTANNTVSCIAEFRRRYSGYLSPSLTKAAADFILEP